MDMMKLKITFCDFANVSKQAHLSKKKKQCLLSTVKIFLMWLKKSVPLQAWSGPEGSRKLRFPDYVTTAQDGGKVVSPTQRPPLPPGNTPGTHFC